MARTIKKTKPDYDQIACCFQGGGAYRDGVSAIKKSPWLAPVSQTTGIALYDMSPKQHLQEATP